MSNNNCIVVCDVVIIKLEALGFDLGDNEDHGPIFDALEQVVFVKTDKLKELQEEIQVLAGRLRLI